MKKIVILLSIMTLASCSLLPDNGEKDIKAIQEAEQIAKTNIDKFTNQEIARVKEEFGKAVADVKVRADSTLTKQFTAVEDSLNVKAEKIKKELEGKNSEIKKAKYIGLGGIVIGVFSLVISIVMAFYYEKRLRTNVNRVEDLILKEINSNDLIHNEIFRIVDGQNSSSRPQTNVPSKAEIERVIETYMTSKKIRDIIRGIINQDMPSILVKPQGDTGTLATGHPVTPVAKTSYQIYAKESNSMILSNIQDTYQKGKSIYKLTMFEPNASTADVSICIEQEEVKQRILKFDSHYLEPICSVIRSSIEPTHVVIKDTGAAERIGKEEWKVIKPIIVEIK